MDLDLLEARGYTMYRDLVPLQQDGDTVFLEEDEYAEASALQGEKVDLMFRCVILLDGYVGSWSTVKVAPP